MKNLLLCSILSGLIIHAGTVDIKMDPGMREGHPSYIYCDVGTILAGVNFFIVPNIGKGYCLGPGASCSSSLYTVTQNATGVLLDIASVDASREKGEWYCQHDTDRSTNTIYLNNHTIAGNLLRQDWKEPSGPVKIFSAVMILSCTNRAPDSSFTFEDGESKPVTVPAEAVITSTQSSYDGTTCENGNKFYIITLKASYKLDIFNNKEGVTFAFTYNNTMRIAATFSVNFLEFVAGVSEGLEVWVIVVIVVIAVLVIVVVSVIIIWSWKNKKCCFKKKEEKPTAEEILANSMPME